MAAVASPTPRGSRSKTQEPPKNLENFNPNKQQLQQSPVSKPSSSSPLVRSKNPNPNPNTVSYYSPQNKIRQRKFLVAKKKKEKEEDAGSCKCKGSGANANKCVCVAYNNLRKSQEEFFKNNDDGDEEEEEGVSEGEIENVVEEEKEGELLGNGDVGGNEVCGLVVKRRRERFMEEARRSVPQSGSGNVMHLVKAFENLLSIPKTKEEEEESQEKDNKVDKWPLPGLQQQLLTTSQHSFCPPHCVLTSENLGLDPGASVSASWDSSRGSVSSRTSTGGRRSRRNSLESSSTFGRRRLKKKQQKVTNQKPFKLRTEQRGKLKEEEFVKKIQEMAAEEEKQRIPIAQGLPWTTDEPECLVKPPVKEITKPIDLKLHSDVRALDRAEFDYQVQEKLSLIEQYKLERERQQKLAAEEEVRRLRKELVPKAQPMPYFDRPFIPRRSIKSPTIPREPKFHNHKKIKCSLSSWTDTSPYSSSHLN